MCVGGAVCVCEGRREGEGADKSRRNGSSMHAPLSIREVSAVRVRIKCLN